MTKARNTPTRLLARRPARRFWLGCLNCEPARATLARNSNNIVQNVARDDAQNVARAIALVTVFRAWRCLILTLTLTSTLMVNLTVCNASFFYINLILNLIRRNASHRSNADWAMFRVCWDFCDNTSVDCPCSSPVYSGASVRTMTGPNIFLTCDFVSASKCEQPSHSSVCYSAKRKSGNC